MELKLLKYLLPLELCEYFDLIKVEEIGNESLSLCLDEKKVIPPDLEDFDVISHGFTESVSIHDFPLRERSVFLIVRRRKWKEKSTGKIHTRNWDLTAKGTSYSKDFAAFLKELFG